MVTPMYMYMYIQHLVSYMYMYMYYRKDESRMVHIVNILWTHWKFSLQRTKWLATTCPLFRSTTVMVTPMYTQWCLSVVDTIGIGLSVLIREVSSFQSVLIREVLLYFTNTWSTITERMTVYNHLHCALGSLIIAVIVCVL